MFVCGNLGRVALVGFPFDRDQGIILIARLTRLPSVSKVSVVYRAVPVKSVPVVKIFEYEIRLRPADARRLDFSPAGKRRPILLLPVHFVIIISTLFAVDVGRRELYPRLCLKQRNTFATREFYVFMYRVFYATSFFFFIAFVFALPSE